MKPYGSAHNSAFHSYAAAMDGQSEMAYQAATDMRATYKADVNHTESSPSIEIGWNLMLAQYTRFGSWKQILSDNETTDTDRWPYSGVLSGYSRALAWAALGDRTNFDKQAAEMEGMIRHVNAKQYSGWDPHQCAELASVANASISARKALLDGDCETAVRRMTLASEQQLEWEYTEPPEWHYPVRQCLGAVLLHCGRPAEAESVYRADLRQYLRNPWSLLGLSQAMQKQPVKYSKSETELVQQEFDKAWRRAETKIETSCPQFFG